MTTEVTFQIEPFRQLKVMQLHTGKWVWTFWSDCKKDEILSHHTNEQFDSMVEAQMTAMTWLLKCCAEEGKVTLYGARHSG